MDKNWQMLTKENKLIGLTILTVLFPGKYYHLANIINHFLKNIDPIFYIYHPRIYPTFTFIN